ncbi:MAG TPA: hypothetical protein VGX91_10915 [Candidatus Cybelea sp.]|nr:hypothetical protein [Candidatus Cybelea sp.]
MRRRDRYFFAGLVAVAAAAHWVTGRLLWTGDEQRYAYQALGFYGNHALYPSLQTWNAFLRSNGLNAPYFGATAVPFHSLAPSAVFGAILYAGGLEAARWLNFFVGMAGAGMLFALLRREFPGEAGATRASVYVSVATVTLALPLLAYLKLLYPEALLFALVAAALLALSAKKPWAALAAIAALPFVYVRALPLAVAFAAIWIARSFDGAADDRWRRVTMRVALCAIVFGGFAIYQHALWGSLDGGAFPTFRPSLWSLPDRLGMQLFGVRHGLLAYSPFYAFGFAGLIAGALRRRTLCLWALGLLTIYVGTFVWAEAGEAWTARYWVAGLPFLAVGICCWSTLRRTWALDATAGFLAAITFVNSVLFVIHPLWFLESRRTSVPYSEIARVLPLDFGLALPVDAAPNDLPAYTRPVPYVLLFAFALVALLAIAGAARGARVRTSAAIAAFGVVLAAVAWCCVSPLPPASYAVAGRGAERIVIALRAVRAPVAAQFDDKLALIWSRDGYPAYFGIACLRGAQLVGSGLEPSRPLVTLPRCPGADRIEIHAVPAGSARQFFTDPGAITLLQRPW